MNERIRKVARWLDQPAGRPGRITFGIAVALLLSCAPAAGPGDKPPPKGGNPKGNCTLSFVPWGQPRVTGGTSITAAASSRCQKPYPSTHTLTVTLQHREDGVWKNIRPSGSNSDIPKPGPEAATTQVPCQPGAWRIRANAEGGYTDGNPFDFTDYSKTRIVGEKECHD